jgi:ribosomal-protein-alanine N-acetyltransferase
MLPKTRTIETKRLLLRIPDECDIPFVFSASRYPGFTDGMLWEPPSAEAELIQPLSKSIKAWEKGVGYSFTITIKGSPDLIGRISIRKTDLPDEWNVGFWTHPKFQNKGVMTEALQAILKFGFEELSAEKIEACYAIWNKASEKVLSKAGLGFDRFLEKGFMKKGKWVEENLFAIDKERWREMYVKE